jgi:hypothetical protein
LLADQDDDMSQQWVKPGFGKGEIDRAGRDAAAWWDSEEPFGSEIGSALVIVENWRTSHSMPLLTSRVALGQRARKIDADSIVAQRLKRFSSIMSKLCREKNMKLSQMQDLGGCRAIVKDVAAVYRLFDMYREPGQTDLFSSAAGLRYYDRIKEPKPDGYRGIHIVGRYQATIEKNEPWNGHRIEIQLRTHLQHAFATAVETVTTFTSQPLKFGAGPANWRRFFSLMGSAMALREEVTLVPETPHRKIELVQELKQLTRELKVYQRLKGWANALEALPRRNMTGFKWLMLVLNVEQTTIKVTGFRDRERADKAIADLERRKNPNLDAVLVWVNSARELRAAYPNYYADTGAFLNALSQALRP